MQLRWHQTTGERPHEEDRGARHPEPDDRDGPLGQPRPVEDDWECLWLDLGGEG
jgi:hypothetical protein